MEGGVWGIVAVISAFMIQFVAFGISGSIGVYNIEFLENFETNAFEVSLLSSINLGMFLGTGPIASYLMDRYSHRSVVLVGGLMSSFGILAMPWLPGIPYMYLCYGIINGLGGCLSYVPSHVLSGLYYDKYQGLATGLATGGSGLGITVAPIIIAKLIEEYTWKGSLLILSGISFNVLVFGALLRPPPPRVTQLVVAAPIQIIAATLTAMPSAKTHKELKVDKENNIALKIDSTHPLEIDSTKPICLDDVVDTELEKKRPQEKSYMHKIYKNIISNVDFMIYFVNNIFWNFGLAVALAFLAEYCVQNGVSKIDSAVIVTIVGLGNFIGCLFGGVFSNIKRIDSILAFCVVNITAGICLIMVTFVSGYNTYLVVSFLFGLSTGVTLGYLLAITGDILGPEYFGDGVGIIMIANGVGAFAGPSVVGYLEKDYGLGYGIVVGGIFCIIGGFVILLIPLRKCFMKNIVAHQVEGSFPEGDLIGVSVLPKNIFVIPAITVDDVSDCKDIDPDAPQCSLRKNSFFKTVDLEDEK